MGTTFTFTVKIGFTLEDDDIAAIVDSHIDDVLGAGEVMNEFGETIIAACLAKDCLRAAATQPPPARPGTPPTSCVALNESGISIGVNPTRAPA